MSDKGEGQSEPHWIIKHGAEVVIGVIVSGALVWIGTNYQEVWNGPRCLFSCDPLGDGCRRVGMLCIE